MLDRGIRNAIHRFLQALIDQNRAQVIVPAYKPQSGYWFGGGNLVQDETGVIWLSGRYRNHGDSRSGLAAGERGLECALFRSPNMGKSFRKILSWSKADFSKIGKKVISIEGTALHQLSDGRVELFISSEKEYTYPEHLLRYQKPETGIWSIDKIIGRSVEDLDINTLKPVLEHKHRPEYLHIKDPVLIEDARRSTFMFFCSHPFTWASGNTGLAVRQTDGDQFEIRRWEAVPRGTTWDVASTRITGRLRIPPVGILSDAPPCSIYFYDGCESIRALPENKRAFHRARGSSCEEIGGAFFGWDNNFPKLERLSNLEPLFVSPHGTGSSRYANALLTPTGVLATWQQSQPDLSQPLVSHVISLDEITTLLAGR